MKFLKIIAIFIVILTSSCTTNTSSGDYSSITDADIKPNISDVLKFLKTQDYANNPSSWHLFPGTTISGDTLKRLGLPVHGRWVRTYVNQIAHDFLTQATEADITQPLEFPIGSFIVKQNYRNAIDTLDTTVPISSKNAVLGAVTVLYKPSPKFNYCATSNLEVYNGIDCYGGDWFYGFFFQSDFEKGTIGKNSQKIQDNVNTFCVNCHAPAFNTDYVRTLDDIRNPFTEYSDTPYCDRFKTEKAISGSPIQTNPPKDTVAFKNKIEQYIQDTKLSPILPKDVPGDPTLVFNYISPRTTQSMFDSYAWKTFIALNWVNKDFTSSKKIERGIADTTKPFIDNVENPTVWETYKPTFEVFQPGNISWNPVDQKWNQPPPEFAAPSCQNLEGQYDFVITMSSKTRDVVNETGQAFAGSFGYLVDQDQKRVRYEVLFNRTEFEYLIGNGRAASLNLTPSGPKGLANKVDFPDTQDDTKYNEGSIEIKSAWKELCLSDKDDCVQADAKDLAAAKKKFLVRSALIYDAETKTCRIANMALVGLHIARKTYFAPQWIWITFEHKDNVPDAGALDKKGTFYNSNLKEPDYCYQLPFLYEGADVSACPNVDLNRFGNFAMTPNQLTRLVPIDPVAQEMNTLFQKELEKIGSPFANYVLVNAQWALNGRKQDGTISSINCKDNGMGDECFTMKPRFLRNSVIESYMSTYCEVEGKNKQVSNRSCMGCHGTAGADLSYVFLDAVSQRIELKTNDDKTTTSVTEEK